MHTGQKKINFTKEVIGSKLTTVIQMSLMNTRKFCKNK